MDESKIFIVGANGQLGTELQKKYPNAKYADIGELDITSRKSVEQFNWSGIEVLINAAAYTNVDGAETNEGRRVAWKVNGEGVANLVSVAAQHDMKLVHISTEYVFDGEEENHTEEEGFSPLGVYGQTKAAGDLLASLAPKFYILRISWLIGEGKNFVRTMIGLADKNISPTVVHDQVGRLTFTSELVRAIDFLLANNPTYGTYNLSNGGEPASWADITREIFMLLKRNDLTVTNTTTAEYFAEKPGVAPRPLNSTLDLTKIHATGFESTNWKENLKTYIDKVKNI